MFLDRLKRGEIGIIQDIQACQSVSKRLYELGLNRGARVEVVKNNSGPIILNISGYKLAIGRGLASRIIVDPI